MRFNAEAQDKIIVNLAEYMPDSIPDAILKVEDVGDKTEEKDEFNSLLAKLLALLGISKLAGNTEPKPQPKKEETAMPADIKKKMQALKDNGSYKDNMTEDEINNAFEKMGKTDDAEKAKEVAQNSALLNAIQALTDKVDGLESKLNAKDESIKNGLVDELKGLDTGLSVNALNTLDVEDLQALHNKATGQTFALNSTFRQSQEAVVNDYSDSFQNTGAK
jgi:hypothetical protein